MCEKIFIFDSLRYKFILSANQILPLVLKDRYLNVVMTNLTTPPSLPSVLLSAKFSERSRVDNPGASKSLR